MDATGNNATEIINLPARRQARVRRLDEASLRERALAEAKSTGKPVVWACHGGTVANSYKWPASTEAALVVAYPTGDLWMGIKLIPANKATAAGAAAAHLPAAREMFDGRCGEARREAARAKVLTQVAQMISPKGADSDADGWRDSPFGS